MAFLRGLWLEQRSLRAGEHAADILRIEQHRPGDVAHRNRPSRACLAPGHAMVDDQPALRNADWRSTAPDLGRLPGLLRLRHLAVPADSGQRSQISRNRISRSERNPDTVTLVRH